ncbi:serine hydrolase domain-containing protein [Streptomyces polychromogenes]|uniref:Serine hydrolase domain-containing protein n=1 Tax=Streptomyces polychromogenes TaxID=67342 RepID=A0ABP3F4E2_9ACTN
MTNLVNSCSPKSRWLPLAAACAALATVTAAALPASAATGGDRALLPAPAAVGDRYPVDEAGLAKLMAPGPEANGTMVRVTGPGTRWVKAVGPVSQDPAASFRIGSMTKMFTSTVVLQLVAEGHLGLNTPIAEVLPDLVPAAWHPITVGQLLSHTSGLGLPCGELKDGMGLTPQGVVAAWTKEGCPAPEYPVTRQQYNGGNYFLLGLAIEKVTGRSYADEVQRRIARPLGLHHTYVPRAGDASMPTPSLAEPTPQEPWAWAEGGMISNAPDVERFMKALLGGRLLPPAQQARLTELPELARTAKLPFSAAGLMTARLSDGTRVWGKTGSMAQYTSGAFATADGRRVVTYSYLPTPELTSDQAVARAVALIEAAL